MQYNIASAGLILPTICFVFATFPICKLCHQLLSELQQQLVQIGKKQRNQSMQLGPSEVLESWRLRILWFVFKLGQKKAKQRNSGISWRLTVIALIIESVQDFLIKLDIKPMRTLERVQPFLISFEFWEFFILFPLVR